MAEILALGIEAPSRSLKERMAKDIIDEQCKKQETLCYSHSVHICCVLVCHGTRITPPVLRLILQCRFISGWCTTPMEDYFCLRQSLYL